MTLTPETLFRRARKNMVKAFEKDHTSKELDKLAQLKFESNWLGLTFQQKATIIMELEGEIQMTTPRQVVEENNSLDLRDNKAYVLPENLIVHGDLCITKHNLTHKTNSLVVYGNLYAWGIDLSLLPNDIKVTRQIIISNLDEGE